MNVWVSEENLPFFEALSSPIRIRIIEYLAKGDANIKELAQAMGVTSAMMTVHVKKLEEAGLIASTRSRKEGKLCSLINQWYVLRLPTVNYHQIQNYELHIGVGKYTRASVQPTCGLADCERLIGSYDEPRCFYDPDRVDAQLIWFTRGYVEYEIPNYVPANCKIVDIEISAELSSEHPHIKNEWESDINVHLNDELLCTWVSPGDYGNRRGKYTPSWWVSNQYGLLKRYEINQQGVYLDREQQSEKTIAHFHTERDVWVIRFEVCEEKRRPGGLTIFGERFGDYPQDILVKVNYERCFASESERRDALYEEQPAFRWGKVFAQELRPRADTQQEIAAAEESE